jgi:hypothetical protein
MDESEKRALATTFISGLTARSANTLGAIMVDDVVWTIPGTSRVSGEARGVKEIVRRAEIFGAYSLKIEILNVVFGLTGVALLLHNTGSFGNKKLDEKLTTVIQLAGSKIKRLDTYISDVNMLNEYFL